MHLPSMLMVVLVWDSADAGRGAIDAQRQRGRQNAAWRGGWRGLGECRGGHEVDEEAWRVLFCGRGERFRDKQTSLRYALGF